MTKNETAAVIGVLLSAQAWCQQCRAGDYVKLLEKWIAATHAHAKETNDD